MASAMRNDNQYAGMIGSLSGAHNLHPVMWAWHPHGRPTEARHSVGQSGFRKQDPTMPRHQLPPTPGRPLGSKNRFTLAAEQRLQAIGLDPIEPLAGVVLNDDGAWTADHRLRAGIELVSYVAPKRTAIEHTGDGAALPFVIFGAEADASAEAWEARNNPDRAGAQP